MELVAEELAAQDLHGEGQESVETVALEVQIILMVTATLIQVVAVEMVVLLQDHSHMEMADLAAAEELAAQVEL